VTKIQNQTPPRKLSQAATGLRSSERGRKTLHANISAWPLDYYTVRTLGKSFIST